MTGEIDAVGDAVTGAMWAQAVEPGGSGAAPGAIGADGHTHERACLNCGTTLIGTHCHGCGQMAHVHRSLMALVHDLAHGVFHFEGKIWGTLPLLARRPGDLTRRYIHGERTRFISPMALFLFSVFLMFAVFSWVGGPIRTSTDGPDAVTATTQREGRKSLSEQIALSQKKVARIAAKRAAAIAAKQPTAGIDKALADARKEVAVMNTVRATFGGPDEKTDGLKIDTGIRALDVAVAHASENPKLLIYKLESSAYKLSWALIPISLPFIWLMFAFRRDVGLYDHAIFAIYSLSAMTLLVIALSLAAAIGVPASIIVLVLMIVPPWHMYRQLKGAYRLGRFGAAWRTMFLLIAALLSAALFLTLLIAKGVSD